MIEIVREAWAESPARVILAIPAAVLVVVVGCAFLVVAIVAGQP